MDPQARFEAIFAAHYRDIHRFALRRTDPAEAEEVANEAFAICWAKLAAVPDPPLPWLYAVARKCLANRRRAAARRACLGARLGAEAGGRDPAEQFAERDAILRAFVQLSERDREALRLVAWDGLPLAAELDGPCVSPSLEISS